MTTQTINLNLIPQGVSPVIHVSQYDKGQTWIFNIYSGDTTFNIPSGSLVTIEGTKPDNTGFQYACSFSGYAVTATEQQQMTVLSGKVPAELRISKNDELIGTLNFIIQVEPAALSEDTIISETMLPLIEEAAENIELAKEYRETSEAYAVGTRNGTAVPSTDPAYHNNAKYYADNFVGYVTDSQYNAIQTILN